MNQRCGARNRNNPNNDNRNNGFRLALSTFSSPTEMSLPEMPGGYPNCLAEVEKWRILFPSAQAGPGSRPDK
jgi:hypothetical protein